MYYRFRSACDRGPRSRKRVYVFRQEVSCARAGRSLGHSLRRARRVSVVEARIHLRFVRFRASTYVLYGLYVLHARYACTGRNYDWVAFTVC